MSTGTGRRISWADLPDRVRSAVEAVLGSPVVAASSQPGGFSPGTADRVVTGEGRRAFVKAAGLDLNPDTPGLHRREVAVTAALPDTAPAPRLLGSWDDGDWVAIVLEDVEGRHPHHPWTDGDLGAALTTLSALAETCTPAPLIDVPDLVEDLREDFGGWDRLRADPPPGLDPWAHEHFGLLTELAAHGLRSAGGDTLTHVDAILAEHPPTAEADPDALTGFLAGLAGLFLDRARRPAPQGLPTVRSFQQAQGVATLRWLRRRKG